ncbi:MAG: iron ABC transporter permease [Ectothiorhodospiraceae bacterium AqS1]|nr:iron ABC transporter permease [Ectothiorhodospiraceae bacterium AqS1]
MDRDRGGRPRIRRASQSALERRARGSIPLTRIRGEGLVVPILVCATALALFAACLLGSTPMSGQRVLAALLYPFQPSSEGQSSVALASGLAMKAADSLVVWQIRLPRALAAFITGAALGAGGAALQGLLRNPLAEPGVLGVSSCAALAATFAIHYGLASSSALGAYSVPVAAIAGSVAATTLLAFAASRTSSVLTLILIGVGLSAFAGALMSLLLNLAPNPFSLAEMINWMLGSVANRSYDDIALVAPFMIAGLALLFVSRRGLFALTLGEEAASGVGLHLGRLRLAVVVGAGLAAGASVALAGAIGFVGIVAPHLVRPMVGHDPARSLLPSALLAGLILVLADIGVRLLPSATEIKLGVAAAILGAPIFVWIAARRRSAHG